MKTTVAERFRRFNEAKFGMFIHWGPNERWEFAALKARKHFRRRHHWAVRSRLGPMTEAARMCNRRFENLITYVRPSNHRHRQRSCGSM